MKLENVMKKFTVTASAVALTVALSACAHHNANTDTSDMERKDTVSTYNTTGPAVGAPGASTTVIVPQTTPSQERNGSAPMTTQDTLSRNQRPTSTGNIESTTARVNTKDVTTTTTVPATVTSATTVVNSDLQPVPAPAPQVATVDTTTSTSTTTTTNSNDTWNNNNTTPSMSSSTTTPTTETTTTSNTASTTTHRRHHRKD